MHTVQHLSNALELLGCVFRRLPNRRGAGRVDMVHSSGAYRNAGVKPPAFGRGECQEVFMRKVFTASAFAAALVLLTLYALANMFPRPSFT